ncbi:MAG TPA: hypothetical protein PLQ11_06195 [Beijerinckiaceae bacterium]|nr:hypothetical protein [Beijerinckiaceae bacterium]
MTGSVKQRTVAYLGGYYPLAPDLAHERFVRDLATVSDTWSLNAKAGPATEHEHASRWPVTLAGPDWRADTDVYLFCWNDLIDADRSRSWFLRLPLALWVYADFVLHGAFWRYLTRAWRYCLFFLYPFVLLGVLAGLAWLIAAALPLAILGPGWAMVLRLVGALAAFAVLARVIGRPLMLDHLLDDWIYARRLLTHGDAEVDRRLDRLADDLASRGGELLVVGHSLGAVHGAELIAKLLARRPEGPPVHFVTLGSSILKLGYHSGSFRLRATLAEIAASPRLVWQDFHAHNDPMNFYRREPVSELGLTARPAGMRSVRFRTMLSEARYRRIRRNFFRLHSQFVSANDRRARYDYYLMLCGPFALPVWAGSDAGFSGLIGEDGRLTDAGKAALEPAAVDGSRR